MGFLSKTGSVLATVSGARFMIWSIKSTQKASEKIMVEPAKSVWRSLFWWKQDKINHEDFNTAVERIRLQVVAELEELGETASVDMISEEVEIRIADTLRSLQQQTKNYLWLAGIAFTGTAYVTFFGQTVAAATWLCASILLLACAVPGAFRCWQIKNRRLGGLREWADPGEWFRGL